MRQFILNIFCLIILGGSLVSGQETLTILGLNDTHSNLSALGPREEVTLNGTQGGIARAASYINSVRTDEPNTMLLHAGDSFVGDLFFNYSVGIDEFTLLQQLGVDAMTLGNHEFDLTTPILAYAYAQGLAPVPVLSANFVLIDTTLQQFADIVLPYIVKQYGSFKVGVIGLTTPETNLLSLIQPEATIDENFIEIAGNTVQNLIGQDCNLIVLLSHLGCYYDQMLAENVPGISVIVGGHDHYKLNQCIEVTNPGGTITYIMQAGSFYQDIGKLDFVLDQGIVSLANYQMVPLDNTIPEDPVILGAVNSMISDIEDVYGPVYTQQIAAASGYFEEIADNLMTVGFHDTPAGNLITDAFRITMGTDIALEAGGSIAQPIFEGPLTGVDLFRCVGYGFNEHNGLGFPLQTFEISGTELCKGLEYCLSTIEMNDEFLPQVSGMSYQYDPSRPVGDRLDTVFVNGTMIDPSAVYSAAANQMLVMILESEIGLEIQNVQIYPDSTEFQVLMNYVLQEGMITPVIEGRVQVDLLTKNGKEIELHPDSYELFQNYPNPFNPETEIMFRLSASGHVILKIYDMLGTLVQTLVNEYRPSGIYKATWNPERISSGVYFYSLEVNGTKMTKKMILLR